jgi:hypothetical protein
MLADSIDDDASPAECLERMKNEFIVAQQRRRAKSEAAAPSGDTDAGPVLAGPADETPTGIAAVRP